jgi:hypothetical protein
LDERREDRLRAMAERAYESLRPTGEQLAAWSAAFAQHLLERNATARTWSRFYDDLITLFAGNDLGLLKGRQVLLDQTGKLRSVVEARVYVRAQATKGKRSAGGIPMPPSTLTRRYRFLDERITLSQPTMEAFVRAGLLEAFDPVVALGGLRSALGANANNNRRQEALVWAFHAWRAAGSRIEETLRDQDLHVLTISGWLPSSQAAFSSSWTGVGRVLEQYLFEASEVSADCKLARERLLVSQQEWPVPADKQWGRFLEVIGVADGLRPVPANIPQAGHQPWYWRNVLRQKNHGCDDDWWAEVDSLSCEHPNTHYRVRGAAWRFAGQVEYEQLSEAAREALCTLLIEHLRAHRTKYFSFRLGRFERVPRERDVSELPTPFATFLRSKPWIAASTRDGIGFRQPSACWVAKARRGLPRFVDRVPEALAAFADNLELAEVVFSEAVGLQDWTEKTTAVARLSFLATIASDIASHDRPSFREQYKRAWQEVAETQTPVPADLTLVVNRGGQITTLDGDAQAPAAVIVCPDASGFRARIISATRRAVLEVGEASPERITEVLQATGGFSPLGLDGIGVSLLVDGNPFVPSAQDRLLTTFGLEWLPEVLVIGHELRGEQLEKGVLASTVDRKARAIRARRCGQLSLLVDGQDASPDEALLYYAIPDEKFPTLILADDFALNWKSLARPLGAEIARLIDTRLRTPENLLLKLALDHPDGELAAPTDEALARALDCDEQTIAEHRAALRTDLGRVLHLLAPVVACISTPETARQLRHDAEKLGAKFDPRTWLKEHVSGSNPEKLLESCEQAGDRAEVRRLLRLDFAAFNKALLALGEPPVSNEAALRQFYNAYLVREGPALIDRLRRHHLDDFRNKRELDTYVERKSLTFLPFHAAWVLERETLDQDTVAQYVRQRVNEVLGEDKPVRLQALASLLEANRKTARAFAGDAMPVLRVWCNKHETSMPTVWETGEAQSVARQLENSGLLDFERVTPEQMPRLCRRAAIWPDEMPETLTLAALGLEPRDLAAEKERAEQERQQREVKKRSITFGDTSLDTADGNFANRLCEIANDALRRDEAWLERSRRRLTLTTFEPSQPTSGRGGGGKSKGRYNADREPTEAQRAAMGLAGEWLAYQFLQRRHPGYVNEDSWVSGNRSRVFGGDEGDDAAGHDFLVKTPQAEWLYEVKSSLEDSGEFELTANELRIASSAAKDGRRRYRILYVPHVFSPEKWSVLTLPNPMGEQTRTQFQTVGRGSLRLRFERQ